MLEAYGHGEIIERCEPFTTPLELALAADCAIALPTGTTSAELLNIDLDTVRSDGDDRRRGAALRSLALRMHEDLMPSLPKTGREPHAAARARPRRRGTPRSAHRPARPVRTGVCPSRTSEYGAS